MFSKRQVGLVTVAVASLVMSGSVLAGSAGANLGVSADVPTDCVISATPVAFGAYKPLTTHAAATLDSTGTITVTCANGGTGATIALGAGANGSGVGAAVTRAMNSGADTLAYQLYTPGQFTTVWGTTGVTGVAADATGVPVNYVVNARIASGLNLTKVHTDYADTVVATVAF